ncbi:MAG TPA: hypothetical protein VMF13_20865 [Luteitalea sp.]|nr:hypothetical protein [Luteitalea sp.]
MVRNVVRLVVLGLLVHAGVRIVPQFWHYLQFKDAVVEVATYPGRLTPDELKARIASIAESHDVPVTAVDIDLAKRDGTVYVSTGWTAQLEYLPTKFYSYDFYVDVEGRKDRVGGIAP